MQSHRDVSARILYVGASQYSGSTLASFLLNLHSRVTTAGHTMGWHFAENEAFFCSCGLELQNCPYYAHIAAEFARRSLPFDYRQFGTEYRLAGNDRLNRYLTASLPIVASSGLERLRDRLVAAVPAAASRLRRHDESNVAFMTAAMAYSGASVYVDNSHDPYRFRQLLRIGSFDLSGLHLVRDPRGVVLSCIKHAGWSAELSMRLWMRRQDDIQRIFAESGRDWLTLRYEDLCRNVDDSLAAVHRYLGLEAESFPGSFDTVEHHILGNAMRLRGGEIRLDEKWRKELDARSLDAVNRALGDYAEARRDSPLGEALARYVAET